jgi:hypothetical protein
MKLQHAFAPLALACAVFGASAQMPASPAAPAATPRIDQRQANQDKRIDQGVASGQLTRHETRRLDREQAAIQRTEHRAKADGVVTAKERKHLTKMQNRASKDIAQQKHDRQKKPRAAA